MRVWRLLKDGLLLQIFVVDRETKQVTSTLNLPLRSRMTEDEAREYVDANYPEVPVQVVGI